MREVMLQSTVGELFRPFPAKSPVSDNLRSVNDSARVQQVLRISILVLVLFTFVGLPLSVRAQHSCLGSTPDSTPITNFVDNSDGTVTDTTTGLMWQRCALGTSLAGSSCVGKVEQRDWAGALQAAQNFNVGGKTGWRLPNIKELASIVEYSCNNPSINVILFPIFPTIGSLKIFWSSSSYSQNASLAWGITFARGTTNTISKTEARSIRLVRFAN